MYYPILRGKRFELLALRDVASMLGESQTIFPIIEPVRVATVETDLVRAMLSLVEHHVPFGVVVDPTVGECTGPEGPAVFLNAFREIEDWHERLSPYLHFVTVASPASHHGVAGNLVRADPSLQRVSELVWCPEAVDVRQLGLDLSGFPVVAMLAPARRMISRLSRDVRPHPAQVLFSDPFPVQLTNTDYVGRTESIFTDEHLYLDEEGLDGFADFATIGGRFTEGGGAPKVVVIHWTYSKTPEPGESGSPIYLNHFWSDEEDNLRDVAAKYAKASGKLLAFARAEGLPDNPALEAIRDYDNRGAFPGLGMLKKFSIVNHLHVVAAAL